MTAAIHRDAMGSFSGMQPSLQEHLRRSVSDISSASDMSADTPSSEGRGVLDFAAAQQQQSVSRSSDGGCARKRSRAVDFQSEAKCCTRPDPEGEAPSLKRRPLEEKATLVSHLRIYMRRWACQLHALQPKCIVDSLLADNAIALFEAYVDGVFEQKNNGITPKPVQWESLAAACLWIAIKADGSRACLPSRALLERAVAVRAAVLSAVELDVLIMLEWEVFGVLRRAGFECTVRPEEEGPERCFR